MKMIFLKKLEADDFSKIELPKI